MVLAVLRTLTGLIPLHRVGRTTQLVSSSRTTPRQQRRTQLTSIRKIVAAVVLILPLATNYSVGCSRPAIASVGSDLPAVKTRAQLCGIHFTQSSSENYAPVAMRLFKANRLKDSIIAFYQLWRCPNLIYISYDGLNPVVEERGLLDDFDRAMALGEAGRYEQGITLFRSLIARSDDFLEARLMLGVFQYTNSDRVSAVKTWRAALKANYFPVPPDFPKPFPVQSGLQALIDTSERRSAHSR